jgi:hypothetical protein
MGLFWTYPRIRLLNCRRLRIRVLAGQPAKVVCSPQFNNSFNPPALSLPLIHVSGLIRLCDIVARRIYSGVEAEHLS